MIGFMHRAIRGTGIPACVSSPGVAILLVALAAGFAPSVFSSGTTAWEMNSYSDFVRGRFEGISLSREGRISLSPKVDTVFSSDQSVIWSIAQAPDGTLYAATGHRGRVYRIDAQGKSSLLWTAVEPEVFAIAVDPNGIVYAGTSPDGKVYRIENGQATEYFAPKTRYIWSLAVAPDGALYVGTGDQGQVFRVDASGQGELYYSTGQSHVTGLAVDSQGRLLAGTEPNGILYRISAKDKAFVLYDASLPEIRAIVPMPDGTVYAAALGGSVAKRAQSCGPGRAERVRRRCRHYHHYHHRRSASRPRRRNQARRSETTTRSSSRCRSPGQFPVRPAGGCQRRRKVRRCTASTPITPSRPCGAPRRRTSTTCWPSSGRFSFPPMSNGRIYGLAPDRRVTLVAQTNEGETTRLLPSDHSVLAATGNMGRIFRLGDKPGASGTYEAPVHDSGTASRWGSLSWRAEVPAGSTLAFRTRTGNSAKPDRTWSDWSEPLTNPSGSRISSPNARYIQWKAELSGTAGATPILNSVTLAYLPQNSPPVVKSINVVTQSAPSTQPAKSAAASSSSPYSVTVTRYRRCFGRGARRHPHPDLAARFHPADHRRLAGRRSRWRSPRLHLYFRSEDDTQWMVLKSGMHDNSLTFDGDILADGKYFFRVVASDRESNPPPSAREAQLTSAPIMIDNTPPIVTLGTVRYSSGAAHIEFDAADAASPLRRCEYSLDASSWVPVEAADGVIDSPREKFVLDLAGLTPGEHLLVIRVADSANNTGLAKVVLK